MIDLENIKTTYETTIKNLVIEKANFVDKFEKRMTEIKRQLNETSLKHLNVSHEIEILLDWIVSMLLNSNNIIKTYQDYIQAIWENIEISDDTLKSYEDKIQEQEEMLSEIRAKNEALKEELEIAKKIEEVAIGKEAKQKVMKEVEGDINYEELAVEFVAKRKTQKTLNLWVFLRTKLKYVDRTSYQKHKYHIDKYLKILSDQEEKKDE